MSMKIALIGYSFRFPNTDKSRFWQDLLEGRNLVTRIDPERWALDTYCHPDRAHPGTSCTFAAGSLGDISRFDAGFFGISPREAAQMDPQQRLLLELAWETLEDAGVKPSSLRGGSCGVYIGISSTDYGYRLADDPTAIDASTASGNTPSIAANRLSYFFDLRGPSMAIDTACSSSLVAFHQACRALVAGETDLALCGGVNLLLHPYGFISFTKASMLSRRGLCSVFDAAGDGYVRSEGGGLFLLKNHAQALADGDRILGVVAASAVNTDGRKTGMTVPSAAVQGTLLRQAYARAGIDPADIDYIEAHGTGTAVGDPIETHALGNALGQQRMGKPLPIGSVKSNLGHLEPASGVAGLVKSLLCLQHRTIPATAGITRLNPAIPFDSLNLEVVTANRPLAKNGRLVVGVNSFGFGGANAHVILESAEPPSTTATATPASRPLPIMISARDANALKAAARAMANFLGNNTETPLYDIAYQSLFRRDWLEQRAVVFGADHAELARDLTALVEEQAEAASVAAGTGIEKAGGPAFIYSGNGAIWYGFGKQLLTDPTFLVAVRDVDAIFQRLADWSIEEELAGAGGEDRYEYTEIAQPVLFAIQVGMTRMLEHLGIRPTAVAGHSAGEIAAAWASGALGLDAAVQVIYHRSQLQGTTKGAGQMAAVGLGRQEVLALLEEAGLATELTFAGSNSSRGGIVAGPAVALDRLESLLAERAIFHRRLAIDYAFHSPAMDPIEAPLLAALANLPLAPSRVPFYSGVNGGRMEGTDLDAGHWWRNIREPVEFDRAIGRIIADGSNVFIEIGPNAILRSYLNDCLKDADTQGRVIATGLRGQDDPHLVRNAAAQSIVAGTPVDWKWFFPQRGNFVDLPHYPWQRERYWHPVSPDAAGLLYRRKIHPLLGYPLPQQELTWENHLDTLIVPSLADHVVDDVTVFPGAGFAELAMAAAKAWQPGEFAEVENLEIRTPLLLGDRHSKSVRLSIDPADGRFVVKSRDLGSADNWETNATGRIVKDPQALGNPSLPSGLPTRAPDFTADTHARLTAAIGLGYGPCFQAIEQGWIDGDTVTGQLRVPPPLASEIAGHHLHPALLDCAFQLIIPLLRELIHGNAEFSFVPVGIGRLVLRGQGALPHSATATLLRRAPHSLTADFTLFDAEGNLLADIRNVRFRALPVRRRTGRKEPDFLEYRSIPMPHRLAPCAATIPFDRLRQELSQAAAASSAQESGRQYTEAVGPLLEALCAQFAAEAFRKLAGTGACLDSPTLAGLGATHPDTFRHVDFLLELVVGSGMLIPTGSGYRVTDGNPGSAATWNRIIRDYPGFFQLAQHVARIGLRLAAFIAGDPAGGQSTQPPSLFQLMMQVLGNDGMMFINRAVRAVLTDTLSTLPDGQRLRIIEIGAGPPVFAPSAAKVLDFARGDYLFVAPDPDVAEASRSLAEHFPALEIRHLDSEAMTAAHGGERPFDLALISGDFTTIEAAAAALRFAGARLADGGSLVLLGQHPSQWLDFVFGGIPGWWGATPDGTRLSPLQPAGFWQELMDQCGFAVVEQLALHPGEGAGSYLLIGRRQASVTTELAVEPPSPSFWLLVADPQGYSAELAGKLSRRLTGRGNRVLSITPDTPECLASALQGAIEEHGIPRGIVQLAGLHGVAPDTAREAYLEAQIGRCDAVREIIKVCGTAQTTCWTVTAGAATRLLPTRSTTGLAAALDTIAYAALWGFVRTLMNEVDEKLLRLIDLEFSTATEEAAIALERELIQPDDEQEVILTAAGTRFVPRLYKVPAPGSTPVAVQEDGACIKLGFQMPGQLRNLRWEAHPRREPTGDEVEVEVHATGLNFRDFMYTLGLLSDEAVENGFSGPTLGLEFAGVVLRTGAQASGLAPGDRVFGFGPASFGSRVITKAGAVSSLPEGLSFEAAATIPATFFTAYYALHHLGRLTQGETVLIHGAAGGVGLAAIQIAGWCGAEIHATAGTDDKRDFLRLLGIEHIYDSRSLAFADDILARTGGAGIDVVLNSLSGEAINRNLRVLKPFGRFLELGKRDFYENTLIGLRPFRNNLSYFGIDADQMMKERPELTTRLFREIMALFREGAFHPLPYTTFAAGDIVEAFRHMQQARQIGKIVVTYRDGLPATGRVVKPAVPELQLDPEATFLVVGGLNGFGLKTAEWLVEKGARNLVLISRSGPASEQAITARTRLEQAGATVLATTCDATDRQALAELLGEISRTMPPLKGVIHSAMVIDDGLIRNMTTEQIRRVMAPKVLGALHLHELTAGMPLDYFILYSSGTTLFGNPGQGNYVAANSWLEALASHRQAAGMPVTCIALGAIDDAGYLARNASIKEALQFLMGGSALTSDTALAALECMLCHNCSGLGIQELDWNSLRRFMPRAGTPKFSELARLAGNSKELREDRTDLFAMAAELPEEELLQAVIGMLKEVVGEVLRIAPEKIDEERQLYDMGLDSLMGVELAVAIESRFGIKLPAMILSENPTIRKLATYFIQQLRSTMAGSQPREETGTVTQARQVVNQFGIEGDLGKIVQSIQALRSDADPAATTP